MMFTRRESLQHFLRIGLLVPLGLSACTGEPGAVAEEELPVDVLASDDGAEVHVVELDPEAARQHMAAMNRCLAERGITPPAGPFKIRFDAAKAPAGEPRRKVLFIAHEGGAPPAIDEVATPIDEATREAFKACLAQVGDPASFRP